MIKQFKHQNIIWIDATNPTKEELASLAKSYNIHSLVETEASSPSHRSRLDIYEKYIYLILHFPQCGACFGAVNKNNTTTSSSQEVDFILGEDFLITIHYEPLAPLEEFGQIFDANLSLGQNKSKFHAGFVFFQVITQLYQSLDVGLSTLDDSLKKAEAGIFSSKEKEMVLVLADINRDLLDFNWSLESHNKIMAELEEVLPTMFDASFKNYTHTMKANYHRIYDTVAHLKEMFDELRITNDSLLTIKTNETMKVLTIMAFITFPLSVLTSTFGMNTAYTPILGNRFDFWIIILIMLGSVAAMFAFFRYKKWL